MTKSVLKKLSLFTAMVLVASSLFGCGVENTTTEPTGSTGTAAVSLASDGTKIASYTFGLNNFGQGAYPLDIIEKEAKSEAQIFGNKMSVANDEFKADKVVSDIQSLISSGVDGIQFFGIAETMFTSVSKICEDAKVPFVIFDKTPTDAVLQKMRENPYFVGAISAEETSAGTAMAKAALSDGCKTAVIVAAAIGDSSHDLRIAGFTKEFEAGGGTVLGVAHCADPTEAVQKSNDLLTAYPKTDCIYGAGGDFAAGALNALASRNDTNMKPKVYATDITPDIAKKLKSGEVNATCGGQWVCGSISNTLLVNYLDGHPVLDKDGKAPLLSNLPMVTLATKDVDAFNKLMESNGSPISNDEYKSLTYRFNPKVNFQTYYDFLANYDKTFLAKLK